jgi:hypothetical protein
MWGSVLWQAKQTRRLNRMAGSGAPRGQRKLLVSPSHDAIACSSRQSRQNCQKPVSLIRQTAGRRASKNRLENRWCLLRWGFLTTGSANMGPTRHVRECLPSLTTPPLYSSRFRGRFCYFIPLLGRLCGLKSFHGQLCLFSKPIRKRQGYVWGQE